jgi:hypothetical protein
MTQTVLAIPVAIQGVTLLVLLMELYQQPLTRGLRFAQFAAVSARPAGVAAKVQQMNKPGGAGQPIGRPHPN